jgi:hypothetical protein
MYAATLLAFKVAQLNVNIDIMSSLFPKLKDPAAVKTLYEYEFYLINVMNYDFYVFSPYKAMIGFIYLITKSDYLKDIEAKISLSEFEQKVEYFIDQTFYTDLIFLYSYSVNTLACIYMAAESYNIDFGIFDVAFSLSKTMDYEKFIKATYPEFKDTITGVKIPTVDDWEKLMKRVIYFTKTNPKYVEKLEMDRR